MTIISDVDGVHTRRDQGVRITVLNEGVRRAFIYSDGLCTMELRPVDEQQEVMMVLGGFINQEVIELYQFHTPDGQGVQDILRAGLQLIIVSGRRAAPVAHRFGKSLYFDPGDDQKIRRPAVYLGVKDKLRFFTEEDCPVHVNLGQSIFIGDGNQDAPLLAAVREAGGIAVTTPDGEAEALVAAEAVTAAIGGEGAFAELAREYIACHASI